MKSMRRFYFWKFNPSGNTTVFLEGDPDDSLRSFFCGKAVNCLAAEQAGFADLSSRRVAMGGGEFCGNACRAFGALLDLATHGRPDSAMPRIAEMYMAGFPSPVRLAIWGEEPIWHTVAAFPMGNVRVEDFAAFQVARLPGITHVLARAEVFPDDAAIPDQAEKIMTRAGLEDAGAAGVIWWRPLEKGLEILPYVRVLEPRSAMIESSCGSGSMALALALGGDCDLRVRQRSGEDMEVAISSGEASIGGVTRMVARGEIWLDMPE